MELFALGRRCRLGADLATGSLDEQGGWSALAPVGLRRAHWSHVRGPQGVFAKVPGLGWTYRALTRVLPLRRGRVLKRDGCPYLD